jgi:hypothetical protein
MIPLMPERGDLIWTFEREVILPLPKSHNHCAEPLGDSEMAAVAFGLFPRHSTSRCKITNP